MASSKNLQPLTEPLQANVQTPKLFVFIAERNAVVAQNQELAVATIQTRDYTVDSRFTQG